MHILFHRAHNQLAEGLQTVNPHWDDEKLFQEARRINIAQFQNLVYGEYIWPLLGYHTAAKMQLMPHHKGYFMVSGCSEWMEGKGRGVDRREGKESGGRANGYRGVLFDLSGRE